MGSYRITLNFSLFYDGEKIVLSQASYFECKNDQIKTGRIIDRFCFDMIVSLVTKIYSISLYSLCKIVHFNFHIVLKIKEFRNWIS